MNKSLPRLPQDDKQEGLPAAILTYEFISAPTAGAAGNLRTGNGAVVFYGDALQAHNSAHDYIRDLKMKYKHTEFENIIIVSVLNNDSINIIHTEKSE